MSKQTPAVLCEVAAERERQDMKWGEQNHASGTGSQGWGDGKWENHPGLAEIRRDNAEADKETCDRFAREGRLSWRHILREEVSEAIAEDEGEALRRELVQVAAVAVGWIECIDRRAPPSLEHGGGDRCEACNGLGRVPCGHSHCKCKNFCGHCGGTGQAPGRKP